MVSPFVNTEVCGCSDEERTVGFIVGQEFFAPFQPLSGDKTRVAGGEREGWTDLSCFGMDDPTGDGDGGCLLHVAHLCDGADKRHWWHFELSLKVVVGERERRRRRIMKRLFRRCGKHWQVQERPARSFTTAYTQPCSPSKATPALVHSFLYSTHL